MTAAGLARAEHLARRFLADESAVTTIEYALLGALIAMAIVAGVSLVGSRLGQFYTHVATLISAAIGP